MINNFLYNIYPSPDHDYMTEQSQIKFKDGCVSYSSSEINVYIKEVHCTIQHFGISVLDACSYKDTVYILCHDGHMMYVIEANGDTTSLHSIYDTANSSGYINFSDGYIYVLTDGIIAKLELNKFAQVDTFAGIPGFDPVVADEYFKCSIIDILKINTQISKFYIYDNKFVIPLPYQYFVYDLSTNTCSNIPNNIDQPISDIVQIGQENEFAKAGIITILSSGSCLYICDNEDMSDYMLTQFDDTVSLIHSDTIHVLSGGKMYEVDQIEFDVYKVSLDGSLSGNRFVLANSLIQIDSTANAISKYTGDTSVVTILCKNSEEDVVHSETETYALGDTVTVIAPDIDGYNPITESIILSCTDTEHDVSFEYEFTVPFVDIKVVCKFEETILSEYNVSGPVGYEYSIEPISIDGYVVFKGMNNTGIFTDGSVCTFEYISMNTDDLEIYKTVKINVLVDGKEFITRYEKIARGVNSIPAPYLNGLTPDNESIDVSSIYNLCSVECNYTVTQYDVYPVSFVYDEYTLYETTAVLYSGDLVIEDMSMSFSYSVPHYEDVIDEPVIRIDCIPTKKVTMFDISNTSSLYKYCIFGDTDLCIPYIENNSFYDYSIQYMDKLKIYNLQYRQNVITMHVCHYVNGTIYHEDFFTGSTGDIVSISPLILEEYEYIGDLNYKLGLLDRRVVLNYSPKIITITTNIKDIENNIISSKKYNFNLGDEQVIRIDIEGKYNLLYKDTEINSDVVLNCSKSIELNYIIYTRYNVNTYHSYDIGIANLYTNLTNPHTFTSIRDTESINDLYVINDNAVDISGTISILDNNNIEYTMIHPTDIYTLPKGTVLINGNIDTKICVIPKLFIDDKLVINTDIEYDDIVSTINAAIKNSIVHQIQIPTSVIDATIDIESVSYNKVSKKIYIDTDINQISSSTSTDVIFDVIDVKTCSVVYSYTYNVQNTSSLSKCYYIINDAAQSSVTTAIATPINNISAIVNLDSTNIIEKYLHIILEDDIGNRTDQYDMFVSHKVTPVATINSFNKMSVNSSSIRYNNRYNGPRESYKLYNTYASLEVDVNNINDELGKINNLLEELCNDF